MLVLEWEAFLADGLPADMLVNNGGSSAVTVGVFDGVHRGHKALIERVLSHRALPVIITFRQNHKNARPSYHGDITSFRQKTALFAGLGVAVTVAADLTDSFRHMSGEEFFGRLRERARTGFIAVGRNFRCGYRQDTGADIIRQINEREGVPTEIVETLTESGAPISSSRIREAVFGGKLEEAAVLLGRPYSLDLSDAPENTRTAAGELVYDSCGCVLPPPGLYTVMLHAKTGESRRAQIRIEDGTIRIPQPGPDCIEFIL